MSVGSCSGGPALGSSCVTQGQKMSALMLLMSQVFLVVIITVGIETWVLHPLKFLFGRATPPTPPPPCPLL